MEKVFLDLDSRGYNILIDEGAIKNLKPFLEEKNYSKVFIITDENLAKNHLVSLKEFAPNVEILVLKSGEKTKSFENLNNVCEEILSAGVDRKSLIIALGGGVIGDLSGFVASILLRGIDFIQIPTTILSCVDSSVGGKTAINSKHGKNLIGSFYQPKLVICDVNFLKTLPKREILSGFAEVIKYGLIHDIDFFEFLENNHEKLFSHDVKFLSHIIKKSCEAKAKIVALDERESGQRALLNFGHTFGHIFETQTNYSGEILHGEAVALGMVMAAKLSENLGLISQSDFVRIRDFIEKCGFVIDAKKIRSVWSEEDLIKHLYKDKKNEAGNLTFILLDKIGQASIDKTVSIEDFKKVLREFI